MVPDTASINQVEVFIPQDKEDSHIAIHDQILADNPDFEQIKEVGQVYNKKGFPEPFYGVVFTKKP